MNEKNDKRVYYVRKEARDQIPKKIRVYRKYVDENYKYRWSKDFEVWCLIGIKESGYKGLLEVVYEKYKKAITQRIRYHEKKI